MSKIVRGNRLYEEYTENNQVKFHIYEEAYNPLYSVNSQNLKRIKWIDKTLRYKFSEIRDIIDVYHIVMVGTLFTKGSTDSPIVTIDLDTISDEDMKKYIKLETMDILLTFKELPVDIKDSMRILVVLNWIINNIFCISTLLKVAVNDSTNLDYSYFNPFGSDGEPFIQHCQMFYNWINDEHGDSDKNEYLNRTKNLLIMSANILTQLFKYKFSKHDIYLADKDDGRFAEVSMKVKPGDTVTAEEIQYLYRIFKNYIYPDENLTFYIDIEGTLVINKDNYSWMSGKDVIDLFVLDIENNSSRPEFEFRKLFKR